MKVNTTTSLGSPQKSCFSSSFGKTLNFNENVPLKMTSKMKSDEKF